MTTLAPLAAPVTDPWVGRFAGPTRSWWLLRDDDPELLGNAVAEVVLRAGQPPEGGWILEARGTSSGTHYVVAVPTTSVVVDGESRALLGPVGPDEVIDALDRAETAGVGMLLLLLANCDDGPGTLRSLGVSSVAPPATDVPLVLTIDSGHRWAAIGALGEAPPPVSHVQVLLDTAPWTAAHHSAVGRRVGANGPPRRIAVPATWIAAGLVTASALLALRAAGLLSPHQTSPPGSPVPAAALPDPRYPPSVAFDPASGSVLLFGGGEPADTTWLWTEQNWKPAAPHPTPSDRYGSAMAYDPALKKMLLFGGREIPGGVPNDTWAWDGHSWTLLAASGEGPPGHEFSAMAWDAARRQMVLVTPPSGSAAGPATWTWSGHGWTRRSSPRAPPAAASTLAFDPATRTVLLVAESPLVASPSATWSWDGAIWQELHPRHAPTLLGPAFMTAVPGARQLLLVTASDNAGGIPQTWTWDGQDWTERQPQLLASNIAGLAGDDARGAVIAFGAGSVGPLSAAWAWTGAEWVSLTPTATAPPAGIAGLHPPPRQFASAA